MAWWIHYYKAPWAPHRWARVEIVHEHDDPRKGYVPDDEGYMGPYSTKAEAERVEAAITEEQNKERFGR